MQTTYYQKLKDPRWQNLRYDKNKDPWDYADKDLLTLCNGCHEGAEEIVKMVREFSGDHVTQDCIRTVIEMVNKGFAYEMAMGLAQLRRDIHAGKVPALTT